MHPLHDFHPPESYQTFKFLFHPRFLKEYSMFLAISYCLFMSYLSVKLLSSSLHWNCSGHSYQWSVNCRRSYFQLCTVAPGFTVCYVMTCQYFLRVCKTLITMVSSYFLDPYGSFVLHLSLKHSTVITVLPPNHCFISFFSHSTTFPWGVGSRGWESLGDLISCWTYL